MISSNLRWNGTRELVKEEQTKLLKLLSCDLTQIKLYLELKKRLESAGNELDINRAFQWALERYSNREKQINTKKKRSSKSRKKSKSSTSKEKKRNKSRIVLSSGSKIESGGESIELVRKKRQDKKEKLQSLQRRIKVAQQNLPSVTSATYKKKSKDLEDLIRKQRNLDDSAWSARKRGKGASGRIVKKF